MDSLYTISIISCIFLIAVVYTCVRISYISSGHFIENSVTLTNSTPVASTLQDLERRLSKIEEPTTEVSEPALPSHTNCDGCKAFAGRIRAEERLASQAAIYPHLGENNFLVKHGQ